MSNDEQTAALVDALEATINRFRSEFEINYATAIGALEVVKLDLYTEAREE